MKSKSEQGELTNNSDDKHPFRRKQQIAISDGAFRVRGLVLKLKNTVNLGTWLGLKVAKVEAEKLRRRLRDIW